MSDHNFDTNKIVQYSGECILGTRHEYWLCPGSWTKKFKHALFEVQYEKFKRLSQNPGQSVHAYNVRWNLERDLVDELVVTEVYPVGSVHVVDLESMYIHILVGPFSSRLLDLHVIGDTLSQVVSGGARDTSSNGSL
jgi:hypothetical protein